MERVGAGQRERDVAERGRLAVGIVAIRVRDGETIGVLGQRGTGRVVLVSRQLEGEGVVLLELAAIDGLGDHEVLGALGVTVQRALGLVAVGERRVVRRFLVVGGDELAAVVRIGHMDGDGLGVGVAALIPPVGRRGVGLHHLEGVVTLGGEGQRAEIDRLGVAVGEVAAGGLGDAIGREGALRIILVGQDVGRVAVLQRELEVEGRAGRVALDLLGHLDVADATLIVGGHLVRLVDVREVERLIAVMIGVVAARHLHAALEHAALVGHRHRDDVHRAIRGHVVNRGLLLGDGPGVDALALVGDGARIEAVRIARLRGGVDGHGVVEPVARGVGLDLGEVVAVRSLDRRQRRTGRPLGAVRLGGGHRHVEREAITLLPIAADQRLEEVLMAFDGGRVVGVREVELGHVGGVAGAA